MIAIGSTHVLISDTFDGGAYRITGTTKNKAAPSDLPVSRRVRLHEQSSGRIVRETWSDATTGAYTFAGLRLTAYYVVSFDHTNTFGGVIADNLTPEPMP